MPSPGGRAGWHFQPLCRWREQEAKRLLWQRSFGKRRNKGGEYGRLTSNVCLMSGRVCVSRVVCTFSLRTQCKEGCSAVMLVQTIEYFFYLIFKAPNKCYAWINFTWLNGMHNVTTVPGQKWLLMNLNRNKEMIMLCCLCLWKADHLFYWDQENMILFWDMFSHAVLSDSGYTSNHLFQCMRNFSFPDCLHAAGWCQNKQRLRILVQYVLLSLVHTLIIVLPHNQMRPFINMSVAL